MNWWEHPRLEEIKYTSRDHRPLNDAIDGAWKKLASDIIVIKTLSAEMVEKLLTKIHPLVKNNNEWFHIKVPDAFKVSYIWDPQITERTKELKVLRTIPTLHTYGYYGFFKPSIAEILSQIPEDILS